MLKIAKLIITKNDSMGQIVSRPEFKGFSHFIIPAPAGPMGWLMSKMKLASLNRVAKTWNLDDCANGLNRLSQLASSGNQVCFNIWREADKDKDPRKQDTALFHFPVHEKGPFVLVCAGGAYLTVASFVEAFPVAAELNRMGYSAFVLHYRTKKENPWPTPMEDLQQALHYILAHANEFNIETENYAVAGFSAGGHLTASLGTDNYGYAKWSLPRPGALFLSYPVTMFENMTKIHAQCRDIMIGKKPTQEQIDSINIIKHADRNYPRTFLWQCKDDDTVYFENSEMLANKLTELGIPCKFKPVESGGHGIGLGNGTAAEGWLAEAVAFWQSSG